MHIFPVLKKNKLNAFDCIRLRIIRKVFFHLAKVVLYIVL